MGDRERVEALAKAHRSSYPMGNIHHGTEENPDWGTFCVECTQSWPCDVSRLLDLLAEAKADAWDEGWEGCANYVQDGHADPKFWDLFHANPYRETSTGSRDD